MSKSLEDTWAEITKEASKNDPLFLYKVEMSSYRLLADEMKEAACCNHSSTCSMCGGIIKDSTDCRHIMALLEEAANALYRASKPPLISVDKALPAAEEKVLVLTESGIVTIAIYEDGTVPRDKSKWLWGDETEFQYIGDSSVEYIPQGWWEYHHFSSDEVYRYCKSNFSLNRITYEKVTHWSSVPIDESMVERSADE